MSNIKTFFCTFIGVIGGVIASLYGGWTTAMTTLIIMMAIDYATGLLVAALFNNSPKSEYGGLESKAGWKGLVRKCVILTFVLVGARIDILLGTNYLKDSICIAYILNEALSIVENGGLMGIPYPTALKNALELLRKKADEGDENNG